MFDDYTSYVVVAREVGIEQVDVQVLGEARPGDPDV